ncbi:MAG TPA: thioesterase [Gammaproteobacteria bacterium]|nr:thioesterase [Gammaproteobacteria bacterium]
MSDKNTSGGLPGPFGDSHEGFQSYQFQPVYMEPGRAAMKMPYNEEFIGDPSSGSIHGGIITLLMDTVGGMCVMSTIKTMTPIATLDLRMDYMRPTKPGKEIIAECECYHYTHSVAFIRGFAHEGDIKDPIAHMSAAFMLNTKGPNFGTPSKFSEVKPGE